MLRDLRTAIRTLGASPGFTAAAVLTLALGIGANTAVFSVVHGVLLRPAPVDAIDGLVMVWETDRASQTTREPGSLPDYLDYRDRARTLESLGALIAGELNLTPPGGEPSRLAGARVTHNLLPLLGVAPIAGRAFTSGDDQPGSAPVVLLSDSLWRRIFNRQPSAIGQTLSLNDEPHTIVGVLPDEADFGVLQVLSAAAYGRAFADRGEGTRADLWVPLRGDPRLLPRSTHPILMVGRLARGMAPAAAQEELAAIAADLERRYPENTNRGVHIEAFRDVVFGPIQPTLYVLLSAVSLVLLVACVNVTSLLLARGAARAREVAVRRALGASRWQLGRQFLAESLVLTLLAAGTGVLLAYAGLASLLALAPAGVPRISLVSIDARVLSITLGISLVVAAVFGIVPSLQARGVDLISTLKAGDARGAVGGRTLGRRILVVAELAFAVMLLAGAGLLVRSFWNLLQQDPGFRTDGVIKAEYQLPATRYPTDFRNWPNFAEQHAFTDRVVARARRLPGVVAVAVAGNHPLDRGFTNSFGIVGRQAPAGGWPELSIRRVTSGYFDTVNLPLAEGRGIGEGDTTRAAPVVVINEAASKRLFPDGRAVGAALRLYGNARTIVGVVADERVHGLGEAPPIAAYLPISQAPSANGAGVLMVRTAGDAAALAGSVTGVIREEDPTLAVFGVEPLAATLSRSLAERRFAAILLGSFAGLALLLGAVGVYGMLSFDITRRRGEIGIRLALGARPSAILGLMLGQGARLAAAGVAVGLAGAFALSRFLSALLFGVSAQDPMTLATVSVLLLAVALAATAIPAWQAARTDAAAVLRT